MASAIAKHPYGSRMSEQTNELPEQLKLMSPFRERNKPPPLPGVSFGLIPDRDNRFHGLFHWHVEQRESVGASECEDAYFSRDMKAIRMTKASSATC